MTKKLSLTVDGKNVPRALDLMLHNDKNTPPFPVIQGPVIAMGDDKGTCYFCGHAEARGNECPKCGQELEPLRMQVVRCKICGIATHWEPLEPEPGARHGVNLRNFEPELLESVVIRHFDGADTWKFID